jgi:SAM-dependent methyltransferase
VSDPLRHLRDVQYRDSGNLAARANLHARYSTARVPWFTWLARLVDWSQAAPVLEVGCGPGWLWEEARAEPLGEAAVTLTDLSSGMLREALDRARPHVGALNGAAVDAEALPFVDGSFDVVLANHMLYHVSNSAHAAGELARVLRPSGTLVAATNGPSHLREVDAIVAAVFGEGQQRKYSDRFGAHNGAATLAPHFEQVQWRPYDDDLLCTDPADVVAYVRSFPPGNRATDTQQDRLRVAVDACFATNGTMRITKETGAFVCRNA